MTKLNDLSKSAWTKLSKTFWSSQKAIQHLEELPLTLESFYLGKTGQSKLSEVDESRVKLIELLTCKNQIVMGDEITKKAALAINRQFVSFNEKVEKIDLIIQEINPFHSACSQYSEYEKMLKSQAYAVFITNDYRDKSGYQLFHAEVVDALKEGKFIIQSLMILVKDQQFLRPYGYPKTFVPNLVNQFVIIAQRS